MKVQDEPNIGRSRYIAQIQPFIGAPFIKTLMGVRRCGKSTILELLREHLIDSGVAAEDIVHINFELFANEELRNIKKFMETIALRQEGKRRIYLLLDEIQMLDQWERAIASLFAEKKSEIFITGSNSSILSTDLAILLSGRYVHFDIRTLSFEEYLEFSRILRHVNVDTPADHIDDYIKLGGFPAIHFYNPMDIDLVYKTVSDIFSTIVLKDILQRNQLRNADFLQTIVRFIFDNTGNLFSARTITGYFTSKGKKISVDTALEYVAMLEESYIIEKVRRYDIRGKKLLNVKEKYYASDISLIHALLGYDDKRISGVLENIVYLELRRRGWAVFVGQLYNAEVDFVCTRNSDKIYIQVAYMINGDPAVIEREFGNLLKIKDQYPKYVVSLDPNRTSGVEGVRHVYLPDFLLMQGY